MAAAAQAAWHYTLIRGRTREGCFRAFRLNHWLGLPVLPASRSTWRCADQPLINRLAQFPLARHCAQLARTALTSAAFTPSASIEVSAA